MPRPEFPRSIVDFQDRFATEEDCREYLFASRGSAINRAKSNA